MADLPAPVTVTVLWQMLQLLAMALLDRPASYLRRNTSLIFLIESLLFAMSPLLVLKLKET